MAEIVRRLDGIPLALELAAARVKVLSPEQIAARLSDRFRVLSGGPRTALPGSRPSGRQWTGATDCWTILEQHLLRHLSVFMGSCTLDAVDAVCGPHEMEGFDVLDVGGAAGGQVLGGRRPGTREPLPPARDSAGVRPGAAGGSR